jgi:hypothetical protein
MKFPAVGGARASPPPPHPTVGSAPARNLKRASKVHRIDYLILCSWVTILCDTLRDLMLHIMLLTIN